MADTDRSLRILIADDDLTLLQLLDEALRLDGHEPSAVSTVDALLTMLRTTQFDLILTDMFVSDFSQAPAVLRELREAAHDTPIVLLTGWSEAVQKAPPELGATGVLLKPFGLDALLELVDEVARQKETKPDT